MRIRTFAAAFAVLLAVTAVAEAQDQGGSGRGRPRGMMMAGGPMGPLPPDSLAAIVNLDDTQRQRYRTLYDNLQQTTQPQRDSLRTLMEQMRSARQSGDRSAGQQDRTAMRGLRDQLMQQRKTFADSVHQLLTSDQQQKLEEWRAAHRPQPRRRPGR